MVSSSGISSSTSVAKDSSTIEVLDDLDVFAEDATEEDLDVPVLAEEEEAFVDPDALEDLYYIRIQYTYIDLPA